MLYQEYQKLYLNDSSDKYHHLPPIDIAKKIANTLHQRFSVGDLTQGVKYRIADKFEITDVSFNKLNNLLVEEGKYQPIEF
ncbi:hypothetical protein [Leuconostoc citreum]|uniref:hypothetical protein n=1 Tax=Leuconostoc citreum TaxID=33964 RepID=UPI0032DFFFCF